MPTNSTAEAVPTPQAPRKARRAQTDNSGYSPLLEKKSLAEGVAHYLNWAALNRPYQFLGHNEIAQCSFPLDRLPRNTSAEVDAIKNCMTRARKILDKVYHRSTETKPGVGVRATVDDFDRAKHSLTKRAKQLAGAAERYVHELEEINPKNIPNTGEGAVIREYVEHGAKDIAKKLVAPSFKQLLLPPADEPKKE